LSERKLTECDDIKKELFKLMWYMRGSINLDQAMMLTYDDRKHIGEIIEENLETTKKTGLPFY
jgi:hypothetical protein